MVTTMERLPWRWPGSQRAQPEGPAMACHAHPASTHTPPLPGEQSVPCSPAVPGLRSSSNEPGLAEKARRIKVGKVCTVRVCVCVRGCMSVCTCESMCEKECVGTCVCETETARMGASAPSHCRHRLFKDLECSQRPLESELWLPRTKGASHVTLTQGKAGRPWKSSPLRATGRGGRVAAG